jgi:hypothetical protein
MNTEDPEVIQLELKYCERCGVLWLRLRGAQEIHCAPCDLEILDLPSPQGDQPSAFAGEPQNRD